jgi:Fic family protein
MEEAITCSQMEGAATAVFNVSLPAEELPERLEALCRRQRRNPKVFIHTVLRAITLHFWLVYDHPFSNGNGRTARALFYWAMLHQDYWLFEFISISSVIHKARRQYERSFLLSESDDNDLTYFLLAQVKVILQAIDSLHAYLERKACFRYTVLSQQSCHGVSHPAARNDLQKLASRGLLIAGKDGRREVFRVPENWRERQGGGPSQQLELIQPCFSFRVADESKIMEMVHESCPPYSKLFHGITQVLCSPLARVRW